MDDRSLYQAILGLSAPWQVERVELRVEPGEVEVWVGTEVGTPHACPDCAAISTIHDHVERLHSALGYVSPNTFEHDLSRNRRAT